MIWKKLPVVSLTVLIFLLIPLSAPAQSLEDEYLYGLDLFKEGEYEKSSRLFKTVLFDINSNKLHGNSAYWLSRTYLEMGHYPAAADIMDEFLLNYPGNEFNMDGRYYKGRLLFLEGEYDTCIQYFSSFITVYSIRNPYKASSLFWIGESLYNMGRFEEAEEIYLQILQDYPASVKVEASTYKLSLIEYKYREEELLKLLQWSHEEFLKSSSEYEKKEKEFNLALKVYQDKLKELTTSKEIYENRMTLLKIKEEALKIKEKLIFLSTSEAENE